MSKKNLSQDEIELGIKIDVPTQPSQTLQGPGQDRSQKSGRTPANPPPSDPMLTDSEDDDPILKAEEARLMKADEPLTSSDAKPAEMPLPKNAKAGGVIESIAEFHSIWLLQQHVIFQFPNY
jgi:hypothetical protein